MNKFAEIWMIATMAIAVLGLMVFGYIAINYNVAWCGHAALYTQMGWVLAPYCMIIEDAAKKREDRKGGKR